MQTSLIARPLMSSILKSCLNKALRNQISQTIISYLAYFYIKLVYKTSTIEFKNHKIINDYVINNKPFIVSFWHGHLLLMACAWQWPSTFNMLISNHRDGKLISKITHLFGLEVINGSTARNGVEAARQIIKKLNAGEVIGITPDGPRGPCEHVSDGVLQLSRLAQVDVIPIAFCSTKMRTLNTWDRFRFTMPFCKGIFVVGTPVACIKDIENFRKILQLAMEDAVSVADNHFYKK